MNRRVSAPVFSSDHSHKTSTGGCVDTPRTVISVPCAYGPRSREVLEVVRAGGCRVDYGTKTQDESGDIRYARVKLHDSLVEVVF